MDPRFKLNIFQQSVCQDNSFGYEVRNIRKSSKPETEVSATITLEKRGTSIVKRLNQKLQETLEINSPAQSNDELDIYFAEDIIYELKNVWWEVELLIF